MVHVCYERWESWDVPVPQFIYIWYVNRCVYVCMYIYICVYICTYIYVCMYVYIYMYVQIYVYLYVYIYIIYRTYTQGQAFRPQVLGLSARHVHHEQQKTSRPTLAPEPVSDLGGWTNTGSQREWMLPHAANSRLCDDLASKKGRTDWKRQDSLD